MEREIIDRPNRGAHVLVLPYPNLQGHINPILQFSKRLASKGLKVTLITTSSFSNRQLLSKNDSYSLDFVCIFDGFNSPPPKDIDFDEFDTRLKKSLSQSLYALLEYYKLNNDYLQPMPKMVIYDAFLPWILDVVKKCEIQGAPFFTQSCVVNSIYYNVYKGVLGSPTSKSDLFSLPGVGSLLKVDDLPTFVSSPSFASSPNSVYSVGLVRLLLDQFSNLNEASCLFINSFDKLELQVVNWMAKKWPLMTILTIGPCIPSMYLDKRLPDDKDYGLSLFQPQTNACQWLDTREIGSVVYISMGSLASLTNEQMEEIAKGLEQSNKYFLWVVRSTEENKLPLQFKEKMSNKGLIVNWCPQLEVLAHHALGCFVTHCGWNSTLEAISLGVPIVAFPQWSDQPTNAKCIVDFWKIGVRLRVDENGLVTAKEVEFCIREVMDGESAKETKNNATKWKQLSIEAMEEDGSTNRNIDEFVSKLM